MVEKPFVAETAAQKADEAVAGEAAASEEMRFKSERGETARAASRGGRDISGIGESGGGLFGFLLRNSPARSQLRRRQRNIARSA